MVSVFEGGTSICSSPLVGSLLICYSVLFLSIFFLFCFLLREGGNTPSLADVWPFMTHLENWNLPRSSSSWGGKLPGHFICSPVSAARGLCCKDSLLLFKGITWVRRSTSSQPAGCDKCLSDLRIGRTSIDLCSVPLFLFFLYLLFPLIFLKKVSGSEKFSPIVYRARLLLLIAVFNQNSYFSLFLIIFDNFLYFHPFGITLKY